MTFPLNIASSCTITTIHINSENNNDTQQSSSEGEKKRKHGKEDDTDTIHQSNLDFLSGLFPAFYTDSCDVTTLVVLAVAITACKITTRGMKE
jgi:hypothetical protein